MLSDFEPVEDFRGRSLTSRPRDVGLDGSLLLRPVGGAVADFGGTSFEGTAGFDLGALTVEFDEDVDDSRTGGRPSRLGSFFSFALFSIEGRLRVGLGCRECGVLEFAGARMLEEYEEAELGVGT